VMEFHDAPQYYGRKAQGIRRRQAMT